MRITLGSLFDGIGGFPLAGLRNGMTTLWASEIEPFPIRVTKLRFPDMKHLGDVTKINGAEIEPVDIITFGSPCQDLSVAGKRAGLAGYRSGLFMEAIRIIREMRENEKRNGRADKHIRPRFAVWENVPGAFSSNKGEDFRAVLEETARIADKTVVIPKPPKCKWNTSGAIMGDGWSIAWRVLDAQFWGVPQRRRRIFLVADFGGQSAPEILFKREGLRRHLKESREAREGIAVDVERSVRTASGFCTEHSAASRGIGYQEECSPTLRAGVTPAIAIENHLADSRVKLDESGTVQTLTTRMGTGGGNVPMLAVPDKVYSIQGSMIGRADKNDPQGDGINEDISFTLNTTDRHAIATKVYGICSYASNSMKSSNPHSGIYEAETSRTIDLNGGNPACNQGGMAIVQGYDAYQHHNWRKADKLGPLTTGVGRVRGDTPLVEQQTYQQVTGPLMANSHPGSYTGQDAYSDMLVTPVYALDRASFNQGENAQYDFQISGDGKTQTITSRGPSAVAESPSYSVRRLTPLECERLQGFPDGWTDIPGQTEATQEELEFWRAVWYNWDKLQAKNQDKVRPRRDNALLKWLKNPTSDSAQYKALGNSVAVCCPEYVLEGIKEVIERGQIS